MPGSRACARHAACRAATSQTVTAPITKCADNHFWVPIDGEWRQVPTEAVVHNAGNPTGEGVVWYVHQGRTSDYFIRCFVPGDDA